MPSATTTDEFRLRRLECCADLNDVARLIDERIDRLESETVELVQAHGRVTAERITAEVDVPGFDRAAMDGLAVDAAATTGAAPDSPRDVLVIGASFPNRPFAGTVAAGQAVQISTGAPLPPGTNTVARLERIRGTEPRLQILEELSPWRNVGRRAEDIATGRELCAAGRTLRPQDLGVLASVGVRNIRVVRRPTVALLATGNELLPCGSRPSGHRIVDSNSVVLSALIRRDGGIPSTTEIVPDELNATRAALLRATGDAIIVTGGSSVGSEDFAPTVLAEIGELCIHGVRLRPARPTGIGFLGKRPVFLLPGNPLSCLCAYDLMVGRGVRRLGGKSVHLPYRTRQLPAARAITSVVGRADYVPVRVRDDSVDPLFPTRGSGASILTSATEADGFVVVPAESAGYASGELLETFLFDV